MNCKLRIVSLFVVPVLFFCASPSKEGREVPASVVEAGGMQTMRKGGDRVAGQYIVTIAGEDVDLEMVRGIFSAFDVKDIRPSGKAYFVITFGKDPGIAALRQLITDTKELKAVQPNFIYRISPGIVR